MALLVLILALIVWRGMKLSSPDFIDKWIDIIHSPLTRLSVLSRYSKSIPFYFILFLALVDVLVIHLLLNGVMWDAPLALAQAALLFYAFGRRHSHFTYEDYIEAWKNADLASIKTIAGAELRLPEVKYANSLNDLDEKARAGILYRAFSDMYVVLFLFVISGVYGPIIYRVSVLMLEKYKGFPGYLKVERIVYYLEWLPARLLGMTFAVAGAFEPAFEWCSRFKANYPLKAKEILATAANMASGLTSESKVNAQTQQADWLLDKPQSIEITNQLLQLKELLARSFQIWFLIIIILSLLGAFT